MSTSILRFPVPLQGVRYTRKGLSCCLSRLTFIVTILTSVNSMSIRTSIEVKRLFSQNGNANLSLLARPFVLYREKSPHSLSCGSLSRCVATTPFWRFFLSSTNKEQLWLQPLPRCFVSAGSRPLRPNGRYCFSRTRRSTRLSSVDFSETYNGAISLALLRRRVCVLLTISWSSISKVISCYGLHALVRWRFCNGSGRVLEALPCRYCVAVSTNKVLYALSGPHTNRRSGYQRDIFYLHLRPRLI